MTVCPILVATCGNATAGDDAFGPTVAEALRKSANASMTIVDLATKPAALLDCLPGPQLLIVVDAILDAYGPPGRLMDTDWFDPGRPTLLHDTVISSHGLSIADELDLAARLDMLPQRVHFIGCTIGSTDIGQPMGLEVERVVAMATNRIIEIAQKWIRQTQSIDINDQVKSSHA